MKDHSRSQLRSAALEVLAQDLRRDSRGGYYNDFKSAVGLFFKEQENEPSAQQGWGTCTFTLGGEQSALSYNDANLLQEIFWEFINLGLLYLRLEELQRGYASFTITEKGKEYILDAV